MKLSVSLADDDLALVDEYARSSGLPSRSAVVQYAIRQLRHPDLERDYTAAWDEWESSGSDADWQSAVADGQANATR
jgi:Arc/MetJ-type ribon-helix-helix transcriptional regulator